MKQMKTYKDYYTNHMEVFEKWPSFGGSPHMNILPKLIGHQWDDYALGAVHAVRPSSIRVNTGMCTCDSQLGRVTVIVDQNNSITDIWQEVMVGIPSAQTQEEDLKNPAKFSQRHSIIKNLI